MRGLALLLLGACYTAAPANRDVSLAWRGRTAAELEDRWGAPAQHQGDVRVWSYSTTRIELPDARIDVHPVAAVAHVDGPGISGTAVATGTALDIAWHPGEILHTRHDAAAFAPGGVIADVQGAALHWGPPNDANIHWGVIYGAHVGMGLVSSTSSPLPSGNAYVGGMLTPTLALVGTYSFVASNSDQGAAIDEAAGVAVRYWPMTRLSLQGGPALLLVSEPGVTNFALKPGVSTTASYAVIKVGTLALDLCADVSLGPSVVFGSLGVGVNVN